MSRRTALLLGAVVLAGAALLGVALVTGPTETPPPEMPTDVSVEVRGEPLPAFGGTQDDPAAGMAAPALHGTSLEGEPISFVPGDEPLAVLFLAHWCPHCQSEVSALVPWLREGGDLHGFRLVSVATGNDPERPNWPPSAWLAKEGWPVEVLVDDQELSAGRAYGLGSFPFWVFVDTDGTVMIRVAGEIPPENLERGLADLAGS